MLFIFPQTQAQTFWMKDMLFPLDFVWIANQKVVQINTDVPAPKDRFSPPVVITSTEPVDQVLEVNSGFVFKNSITVGDKVMLNSP
jgi:uncharacterized membrane protein (UPF0127 family)